jgi:4-amino-4-deoxychorismate lyase
VKPSAHSWVNGRVGHTLDVRDRGLGYGDGLFETMRVRRRAIRLLDYHLERLAEGCGRLAIAAPDAKRLGRELARAAALRSDAVLKLIVTRGVGSRGYRPSGRERATRLMSLHALSRQAIRAMSMAARIRLCETRLGANPALAGLKTLNRLESVLARAEWSDGRVWEGLMRDADDNLVCGTMSNLFVRRGSLLYTPMLDRCGIAGVMRRWVLEQASALGLRAVEGRVRWEDLDGADEVFMTNAVVGVVPVAVARHGRTRHDFKQYDTTLELRARLEPL